MTAALTLDHDAQRSAHLAGLVHDVGERLLPAELLCKPDHLTATERAVMARHADLGMMLLRGTFGLTAEVLGAVRHPYPYVAHASLSSGRGGRCRGVLWRVGVCTSVQAGVVNRGGPGGIDPPGGKPAGSLDHVRMSRRRRGHRAQPQ